eukprot:3449526-Ditylum_brightwellii.AAC.1
MEQKSQRAFATKSGLNYNMKYLIRNSPEELGGANFFSLVHVQGTAQITHFLKHWRTETITGNILRIALA